MSAAPRPAPTPADLRQWHGRYAATIGAARHYEAKAAALGASPLARVFVSLAFHARTKAAALRALMTAPRPRGRCGAGCRDGHPCGAPANGRGGRCKLHGGKSTGPRTVEGKARALAALARVNELRRAYAPTAS